MLVISSSDRLTARFLGACKPELKSVCEIDNPETLNVKDQSQALSCLYRNGKANKVCLLLLLIVFQLALS